MSSTTEWGRVSRLPTIESLSLAAQVAQMVVVRASGYLFDHQIQYPAWEPPNATLQYWLQDLGVGGVILLGGSAVELGVRSQQLQEWATLPLLIAADIEEGVGQRFKGATWFPPPMALSACPDLRQAELYAEQMGAYTAQEALAIGVNWVLAPVVDVNNNPANPVINVRAFGDSTPVVSRLTTAFIRGAQAYSVLTTAKHFPGHGDTAVDSHLDLPVLPHSWERLQATELPPFAAAIAAGVDTVMSAHLQIPALDADYPATLSRRILTDILRNTLQFNGLITTDALVMGAIANRYGNDEAVVLAVEAGADILLMPSNPETAIQAVCDAVKTGRIAPERIQASVERIWQAKLKVCSPLPDTADIPHAWERVSPPLLNLDHLAQPQAIATANAILKDSMQVHCPALSRLSQYQGTQLLRNLIIVDDALSTDFLGRHTPAIALPQTLNYQLELVDSHTPRSLRGPLPQATPSIVSPEASCSDAATLLQLFIRGNPFRGSAGLTQTAIDWFNTLVEQDRLQALILYGSPYPLQQFVARLPGDVPYVFIYGQMPAAQAIALNALFGNSSSLQ